MEPLKNKVIIRPLKRIFLEEGDVFHALKSSDNEFNGFEEAYFSTIKFNKIKAWKRHLKMTMNLIVPLGNVKRLSKNFTIKSSKRLRKRKEVLSV